ncbi:MAG: thiamine ABC transporter substrate-binding protein [Anaerolineae bacterium]
MFRYLLRFTSLILLALLSVACQSAVPTSTPVAIAPPTTVPATTRPTTAPATVAAATSTAALATSAPAAATTAATDTPIPPTETLAPGQSELILVTHDAFAASDDVINAFEQANNVRVRILKSGDAGAALNKEILAGPTNPLGDAFFGVDNTFLSRALKANIFDSYKPAGIDAIPAPFKLDSQFRLTPTDYGDVCLNYDKGWFTQNKIALPKTLEDLTQPAYKSLLVVENPATSSPGLAFLLATIAHFGPDKYIDYWKGLRANDVAVSDSWDDAFNAQFTLSGKGDRPIVVSYGTDPAAEVFFSNGKYTEPPNGVVLGDQTCFRQIEFIGVLKGAKHPDLARKFIDYMVSVHFQEDIPGQMFVYPVNPAAKLPDWFKFAVQSPNPARITPDQIDASREKWITAWTQAVLR